jgi:hypothetical protein
MSDFPKGGDIEATRAWLDKEGFVGVFDGWKADAILGLERQDIDNLVPQPRSLMLWGFLNTARLTTGKFPFNSFLLFHIDDVPTLFHLH